MLKEKISKNSLGLFTILPILSLFQISNVTYGPDILKLSLLLILVLIILIVYKNYFIIRSTIQLIPFILIITYSINQFVLDNDITSFILGRYNRFGGLITIVSLSIIFIIVSNQDTFANKVFNKSLYITYLLMLTYGTLTYLGVLPDDTYYDASDKIVKSSSDLSLTFGNPNLASAFLGIAMSAHMYLIISKIYKNNYLQYTILFLGLFVLFQTNSIQGWMILIFNSLILLIHYLISSNFSTILKYKLSSLVIAISSLLTVFFNFRFIWEFLYINGNIGARLNYWKSSIQIWTDHKLTGVGLDNLGEFSTFYRDIELANQEGQWTVPDRTHNVLLDHLVNGGILAFVLWVIFIGLISALAFRKIFKSIGVSSPFSDFSACLIWFGYLLQSLISVDHIFLTLIGYLSAGLILGDYLNERTSHKGYGKIAVPFFLVAQVILVIFMINQLILSYNVNQFLNRGNTQVLDKIYNARFIEQQSFLEIVVKLSGDKQFKLAALFSEKLLIVNPYAHQAYYAKSVFYESEKDLTKAKLEMEKAHTYDKFNSVYTLSLGIYEYNLNNYPKAYYWLDETVRLNPTQQGIEILKNSLDQLES